MAELIAQCRSVIDDTDRGSYAFTDQDIQDALDSRRSDVRLLELVYAETIAAGGKVTYLDYWADGYTFWEADEKLQDRSWATLTPTTSERMVGHWTFSTNQYPPVYITGKVYDLWGAAADLLDQWAIKVSRCVDIDVAGQKFSLSQRQKQLMAAADRCRAQSQPVCARSVRSDA